MSYFDIILVINWFFIYRLKIDCKDLKADLNDEKDWEVCFYEQREEKPYPLISVMKASKLLCQGCIGYMCYDMDIQEKEETT